MSEMVERVARAIHGTSAMVVGWDHLKNMERDSYLACAKAAVAAMRKPTTLMLIAAGRTDSGCELEFHDSEQVWRAMIDEALK